MSLVCTAELVESAAQTARGVASFNVITLEHAEGIVAGAEQADVPVILQISQNAVRFHAGRLLPIARAAAAVAETSTTMVALHLDHVDDFELLKQAADAGFSSVMFDAGALPYAQNLAATEAAAVWAHDNGLWVEAELGYVGGKPDSPASAHLVGVRTDPVEAIEFVASTGVDCLAVAVGSSHAMTTRSASLDCDLIARIAEGLSIPLVLHGSSGVPDGEIRRAVAAGIAKVNIGTALNISMTAAVRRILEADANVVDPRKYLGPARESLAATVAHLAGVVSRP